MFVVQHKTDKTLLAKPGITQATRDVHWVGQHDPEPWVFVTRKGAELARDMHAAGKATVKTLDDARTVNVTWALADVSGRQ